MRVVSLILCLSLAAPAAFAGVIFEDAFSDGIDGAWSIMGGDFTSTRNGWLLGFGSGPHIGAGGPEYQDYYIKFDYLADQNHSLIQLTINSSQDPATGEWEEGPGGGFITCYLPDDNQTTPDHWVIREYLDGVVIGGGTAGSPILEMGRWYTFTFGLLDNQIIFQIQERNGGRLIEDWSRPVTPGQTRTGGSWNFDFQRGAALIVDNFIVEGSGPVANKSESMGGVKSMFR